MKYGGQKADICIEGVGDIQLTAHNSFVTITYSLQPTAYGPEPLAVSCQLLAKKVRE